MFLTDLIVYWLAIRVIRETISTTVMRVVTCVSSMKNVAEHVFYLRSAVIDMGFVSVEDVVH